MSSLCIEKRKTMQLNHSIQEKSVLKKITLLLLFSLILSLLLSSCLFLSFEMIEQDDKTLLEESEARNDSETTEHEENRNQESEEDNDSPIDSEIFSHGARAYEHLEYIQANLPYRLAFTENERAAANWIVDQLSLIGFADEDIEVQEFTRERLNEVGISDRFFYHFEVIGYLDGLEYIGYSQNIIATMPGESEEVILVMAHYDGVRNVGITDNASGVVLLLENAENLFEEELPYTIKYIFFGAEEMKFLGAQYYLYNLSEEEKDNILMVINADVLFDEDTLFYSTGVHDPEVDWRVDNEISMQIQDLVEELELDVIFRDDGIYMPSDQIPFVHEGMTALVFYAIDAEMNSDGSTRRIERSFFHTEYDNLYSINEAFPGRIERALGIYGLFLEEVLRMNFA